MVQMFASQIVASQMAPKSQNSDACTNAILMNIRMRGSSKKQVLKM